MFQSIALTVGLRYTRAQRQNHFISFISLISMLGLVLGVTVLILVLSVMNGFDRELRQRILGMVPHATVQTAEPIMHWQEPAALALQIEGVLGAAPFVHSQGMFNNRGRVQPVLLHGIEPAAEAQVSILPNYMVAGSVDDLKAGEFNILMGDLLARQLGARIGDKVTLFLPEASLTVAGIMPRLKRFTLVGLFKVGAELDANLAIMHISDASRLKRLGGGAEGLRLKLDDLFKAPQVAQQVAFELPGQYWTNDWTRTHGSLFQAIQLERRMLGLLLMLVIAVAAFNIVSTLVMLVVEKQADIAILRTLGASQRDVMGIFIVQGSVIGVLGTLIGTLLGVVLALNITAIVDWAEHAFGFKVLSADVYFISYFPSHVLLEDVLVISLSSFVLCVLATLYPAWRASRVEPAEVLRHE
ncbi:MAG: lipoprotein-releasing ABC transporter permease subunit [Oceanospirillaceae bacterium]|jgi:lipoprotein-releasing system permease protein|nr:lipoprotein-releasing ABC transporter permease subunit [Oceanospirillaceae bacterium]MBT4443750.1 lipoprotein-releasing ABC transporter permease subunit [Oceanospirillaceae bacterium]MBT6076498.1 lipoprotein-releasing ABC transporter permease subunit [Oceanospirillaceae bacterium]